MSAIMKTSFCMYMTTLFSLVSVSYARILHIPTNQTVCDGSDLVLDFTFDNEQYLNAAIWRKGETPIIVKVGENTANVEKAFENKFVYINNGKIKLLNADPADEDTYKLTVTYRPSASPLPNAEGTVYVAVHVRPGPITYREVEGEDGRKTFTCVADQLGKPVVEMKIKVQDTLHQSVSATVDLSRSVYCCVIGDAAKCIDENPDKINIYCEPIFVPDPSQPVGGSPDRMAPSVGILLATLFVVFF